MRHPFFPDPVFAWAFCGVLLALLCVATYTDLKRLTIPKSLTLTALALGLVFNLGRGIWLGASAEEQGVWLLGPGGVSGAFDGLLFAVAGFLAGFGLFFVMWFLGTCGGGDVKLFAALGTWIGPLLVVYVLGLTLVLVIVLSVLRLAGSMLGRGFRPTMKDYSQKGAASAGKKAGVQGFAGSKKTRQRLMAYSLPVLLSTAFILLWVFRAELLPPVGVDTSRAQAATVQP